MMNKNEMSIPLSLGVFAVSLLLAACGDKAGSGPSPAATAASAPGSTTRSQGAPVSVTTVAATQRDFEVALDAIGTVTPLASVDVKPQINSVITHVHVKEGQFVKTGERLFTLDTRPDEANVAKAGAQLAKDQAVLDDALRQLARNRDLLAKGFISQGAVESSQAQVDAQRANLVADRAAVDAAKLALSIHQFASVGRRTSGGSKCLPRYVCASQPDNTGHHHTTRPHQCQFQPAATQSGRRVAGPEVWRSPGERHFARHQG